MLDLGFNRSYTRDRFVGYAERIDQGGVVFPVEARALSDQRLSPATQAISIDGETETGVRYDLAGHTLAGSSPDLVPARSRSSFWFAIVAAYPDVAVVVPE